MRLRCGFYIDACNQPLICRCLSAETTGASTISMSMAEEAGQKYREVHLHTEPQVIETSFWQKLGAACGCNALQCVAGDGPAMSNEIQTSKYTLITFIPVNLFEQFCRVANLYFLVTAVRMMHCTEALTEKHGGRASMRSAKAA